MDLATEVYTATDALPRHEQYGLISQMRRAAVSVVSNISEGQGRYSTREDQQFLLHARGSLLELETQVLLCERLEYLAPDSKRRLLKMTNKVGQLINGTIRSLRRTENGEPRTENAERRTENGERRTENGERRTTSDNNPDG